MDIYNSPRRRHVLRMEAILSHTQEKEQTWQKEIAY